MCLKKKLKSRRRWVIESVPNQGITKSKVGPLCSGYTFQLFSCYLDICLAPLLPVDTHTNTQWMEWKYRCFWLYIIHIKMIIWVKNNCQYISFTLCWSNRQYVCEDLQNSEEHVWIFLFIEWLRSNCYQLRYIFALLFTINHFTTFSGSTLETIL